MRFESKEFIKSQRQWEESRESKKTVGQNSTEENTVLEGASKTKGSIRSTDSNITQVVTRYGRGNVLTKGNVDSDDNDARDDSDSHKIERSGEGLTDSNPRDSLLYADFSKKELEQLERSKQKRAREGILAIKETTTTTSTSSSYEQYPEGIIGKMVEAFLTARDQVRTANKKQGIAPSTDLDGMLLYMLPSHVWFGGFFNESQDALNKIQKNMLLDYSREY
jgi:hypothetical protein